MRKIVFSLLALALALPMMAQQESSSVRKGNKEYNKEKYAEAEVQYRKGLEKNADSFEAHFNLGDALFRQEKYAEALSEWQRAAQLIQPEDGKYSEGDKKKLAQVYHNMGNALYAQEDYGKAVEAFKQSMMANPKDDETRYNLVKALSMLQQQQQNQEQQQEQNQDQQQQDQQQQQQQQQQDQVQQDEQETQEKAKQQQMLNSKFRTDKDW